MNFFPTFAVITFIEMSLCAAGQEWFVPSVHPDEIREGRECLVVADRRVFAVMAFINAAGFDEEAKNTPMLPVRTKVRQLVNANLQPHPDKLAKWKEAYQKIHASNADYIEYATLLSADYPFKQIGPDSAFNNKRVLHKLKDIVGMVNDLWVTARLDQTWAEVKPDYLAELQKYDIDRMTKDLDLVWRYVRMPRHEARTMVSVPNLLDRHYSADSVSYGKYFVSVEGPGSYDYSLNIHEYLHEIVNPLVTSQLAPYKTNLIAYFERWMQNPNHRGYETLQLYVQECLVKALEARISMRLHPEWVNRKQEQVAQDVKNGFELTGMFFDRLAEFETFDGAVDRFVEVLFERAGDRANRVHLIQEHDPAGVLSD